MGYVAKWFFKPKKLNLNIDSVDEFIFLGHLMSSVGDLRKKF